MKYTIFGFNQRVACNLHLDLVDLALLRWFIDFKDAKKKDGKPKMVSRVIDNETMYWVRYSGVMDEFPIMKFKSEDSVYRRFKKLAKLEILNHKTLKNCGTYSLYSVGKNYIDLISDDYGEKSETNPSKSETNPSKSEHNPTETDEIPIETDEKSEQKTHPLSNPSTKYSSTKEKEQSSTSSDSLLGIKKVIYLALKEVSPQDFAYGTWFEPCEVIETDDKVIIKAPNSIYGIMPRKYMKLIEETLDKPVELIEMEG